MELPAPMRGDSHEAEPEAALPVHGAYRFVSLFFGRCRAAGGASEESGRISNGLNGRRRPVEGWGGEEKLKDSREGAFN